MEKRIIFHGHTVRPIGTPVPRDSQSPAQRIFLLSPANASGIRGNKLLSGRAQFDLALRLPTMGAPLGGNFQLHEFSLLPRKARLYPEVRQSACWPHRSIRHYVVTRAISAGGHRDAGRIARHVLRQH